MCFKQISTEASEYKFDENIGEFCVRHDTLSCRMVASRRSLADSGTDSLSGGT